MIKALLFDFDGVLAETWPYHFAAWQQVLVPEGIVPDELTFRLSEGAPTYKICQALARHCGPEFSEAEARDYARKKNEVFQSISRAQVYPGIKEMFDWAKAHGIKIGLVTGTIMKNLQVVLGDLLHEFDTIITSEDTRNGKPDPEPYLKAAAHLQIAPSECLVVENAPLGIQSAKAAGAICVALTTTLPGEHLQVADVICSNHFELLQRMPELQGEKDS